jgi:hypothetical protein
LRAGRSTADIDMMSDIHHIADDHVVLEYGRHQENVREMSRAEKKVVRQESVARLQRSRRKQSEHVVDEIRR